MQALKLLLVAIFVYSCHSCLPPEKKTSFADFALRSDVVVVAEKATEAEGNEAIFRVVKMFPKKKANVKLGGKIKVSSPRNGKCVQNIKNTKYILFLKKPNAQKQHVLRYRPVPYSKRNFKVFYRVLQGSFTGSPIMQSGCRAIPKPMNGFIKCSVNKFRCSITCKKGYKLEDPHKSRTCQQITGLWLPRKRIACIEVTTASIKMVTTTPTTTSLPAPLSNDGFATLNFENKVPVDPVFQKMALAWRKRISTTTKPELFVPKTTKKIVSKSKTPTTTPKLVATTSRTPVTMASSFKASYLRTLSPAILRAAHDEEMEDNPTVPEEETDGPVVVMGSENDIMWMDNELAVVSGEGDSWVDMYEQNMIPKLSIDGEVYGCPTFEIPITIYSGWEGGFNGKVEFPKLKYDIFGGWIVCIKFSHELTNIDVNNAILYTVSLDKSRLCFKPETYNAVIYKEQDLFIGFVGSTNPAVSYRTMGTGYFMGWCHSTSLERKVVGTLFDGPVLGSFNDSDIIEVTTPAPPASPTSMLKTNGTPPPPKTTTTTKRPATTKRTVPKRTTKPKTTKKATTTPRTTRKPTTKPTTSPRETTQKSVSKPGIARSVPLDPLETWPENRCDGETPNGKAAEGGNTIVNVREPKNTPLGINYNEVLYKSNLFYEAQRSGFLTKTNRIPWRGHSALKDGCDINANLTGGWYNDGGHVKSTYPIAFATTMLAWGAIDNRNAYMASGELFRTMNNVKWAAKYLIACHIEDEKLVAQVGNHMADKSDWGRAEELKLADRTVYIIDNDNPSPEIVAETAAALSATGILFKTKEPSFSEECLLHARKLYTFAEKYPTTRETKAVPASMTKYSPWTGSYDDLAWASLWLSKATGINYFLEQGVTYYKKLMASNSQAKFSKLFYWDDKTNGVAILLAKMAKTNKAEYRKNVVLYTDWLTTKAHRTPSNLIYISDQAPNQHAANAAFLAMKAMPIILSVPKKKDVKSFAVEQMSLLLGSKGSNSFVVGCGPNSPKRPHHMGSSCPDYPSTCNTDILSEDRDNTHILYGALVAGPDKTGNYQDDIQMESQSEVSVVLNAGFQSAAAEMKTLALAENKQNKSPKSGSKNSVKKRSQG